MSTQTPTPTGAEIVPTPSATTSPATTPRDAAQEAKLKRGDSIARTLDAAYQNASNLKLTTEESSRLRQPFLDSQVRGGAKGKTELLYISHIHLSDRLNDVLGIGQWALIRRSEKLEHVNPTTERVYCDGVLLIRGAVAAEAIGVGYFHNNNPLEDYGTAMESAVSDCVTRCCKRLGIGSQIWDKNFCDEWLARHSSDVTQHRPAPRPGSQSRTTGT